MVSGTNAAESPADFGTNGILRRYLGDLSNAIRSIDEGELEGFSSAVLDALTSGSNVFIAGNGGSACASIHMASDWSSATADFPSRPRVVALAENIARLTALANDVSYERAFALQLDCASPSDLLVILSVSGDSPNLVQAAQEARRRGMVVIGALGRRGTCAEYSDHTLILGAGDYGLAEDLHIAVTHMIVRLLRGGGPMTWAPKRASHIQYADPK